MTFKVTVAGKIEGALVRVDIMSLGTTYSRSTDGEGYADVFLESTPSSLAALLSVIKDGFETYAQYVQTSSDDQAMTVILNPSFKRPAPKQHQPLPDWDKSDADGDVHTTPPPELVIPTKFDPLFMRADFGGIDLDANRWGGNPPYLKGANTTPATMLLSPMLIMYPRKWQDAWLTENFERYYSHVIIASGGWNFPQNGFNPTPQDIVKWAKYIKSWGGYVVHWGNCVSVDPFLSALVNASVVDFHIVGEEVNSKVDPTTLENIIDSNLNLVSNGIPIGVHFTSNYPLGFPLDTYMPNWGKYDGKVHLMWQADQNNSAGKQGAMSYYARQRVNLGWQGEGNINPAFAAPNSRVYNFETMASNQFIGKCTEEYGCLRSLELLYCTRLDNRILPLSGSGNGLRYPSGMWV